MTKNSVTSMTTVKKLTLSQRRALERLYGNAVDTSARAFNASHAFDKLCKEIYGCSPADINCNYLIDWKDYGGGEHLTSEQIDAAMRECLDR